MLSKELYPVFAGDNPTIGQRPMEDGLVSVIVNVYDCKDYLPTSLDSVRQQTYSNLEVILVDDCSTDGSGDLCDEYCLQDERFCVIHHEMNTGVSGPRNTGLKAARGEYIYFLDGDDYIHAEAIEALVEAIQEKNAELAIFDFQRTSSLNEDTHRPREKKELEMIPIERIVFEMLSKVDLRWCVSWNKLFKRTLIEGLCFNDYYSIQDQDFNIRVFQKIKEAVYVSEPLYWYFQNPHSLQRTASLFPKKYYLNTLYRFCMLDYLSKKGIEGKYRAWVIDYGYRQMLERRKILLGTDYEDAFVKATNTIIKDTRSEFYASHYIPFKKRVRFPFYWYCPNLAGLYVKLRSHLSSETRDMKKVTSR